MNILKVKNAASCKENGFQIELSLQKAYNVVELIYWASVYQKYLNSGGSNLK